MTDTELCCTTLTTDGASSIALDRSDEQRARDDTIRCDHGDCYDSQLSMRTHTSSCYGYDADVSVEVAPLNSSTSDSTDQRNQIRGASRVSADTDNALQLARAIAAASAPMRCRKQRSPRSRKRQDLSACVLSMKGQVAFLHQLVQQQIALAANEKERPALNTRDLSALSFSSLSPVRKSSVDLVALPDTDEKQRQLFHDRWDLNHHDDDTDQDRPSHSRQPSSTTESASSSHINRIAELERENAALRDQVARSEQHASDSVRELLDEIDGLKRAASAPIHVNHERCQVKIHELWQTIKNLKVYVETYRIESLDLKTQRDEAVASAERAWRDNAALASNRNPQAKIRYLQSVKDENVVLLKKIRELQTRLAAQHTKRAVEKANALEPMDASVSELSPPVDESAVLLSKDKEQPAACDGHLTDSEPERSQLFRKMWRHNKELEAEIARLRDRKRAIATPPRTRSGSTESHRPGAPTPSTKAAAPRGTQRRSLHPPTRVA